MLADPAVARDDPQLLSVDNVNDPGEYERACALPAPEITVRYDGAPATGGTGPRAVSLTAWTLGDLAAGLGLGVSLGARVTLNGEPVAFDPELPLVAGDVVGVRTAGVLSGDPSG
jgi:hypothetical protein